MDGYPFDEGEHCVIYAVFEKNNDQQQQWHVIIYKAEKKLANCSDPAIQYDYLLSKFENKQQRNKA